MNFAKQIFINMHPIGLRGCVLLVALFALHGAIAQSADDIAGSADHPVLERFPDSQIVGYEQETDVSYQLMLGNLRRVAGQVVPERVERFRGDVTRITYEVSQSYTGEDAYRFFLEQARQRGYTQLFTCSGSECGNSNYWANTIFRNRILYGPERNQFFAALEASGDQLNKSYLSLYVATRGNRRIYAYAEVIEVRAHSESGLLLVERLQEERSIRFSGIEFDDRDVLVGDGNIVQVAQMLKDNDDLGVYVVAHIRGGGSVEELLERSSQRAGQVRQRLIVEGVEGDRVGTQGIGPLAPDCGGGDCWDRIELVLP